MGSFARFAACIRENICDHFVRYVAARRARRTGFSAECFGSPQGELHGGTIGVVTHWSPGRFDNVALQPNFARPTTH